MCLLKQITADQFNLLECSCYNQLLDIEIIWKVSRSGFWHFLDGRKLRFQEREHFLIHIPDWWLVTLVYTKMGKGSLCASQVLKNKSISKFFGFKMDEQRYVVTLFYLLYIVI